MLILTSNYAAKKIHDAFLAEFERLRGEIIADKGNPREVDQIGGIKDNGDGTFRIVRHKPFVKG